MRNESLRQWGRIRSFITSAGLFEVGCALIPAEDRASRGGGAALPHKANRSWKITRTSAADHAVQHITGRLTGGGEPVARSSVERNMQG